MAFTFCTKLVKNFTIRIHKYCMIYIYFVINIVIRVKSLCLFFTRLKLFSTKKMFKKMNKIEKKQKSKN